MNTTHQSSREKTPQTYLIYPTNHLYSNPLCNITITTNTVLEKLKKLRVDKSPGPDQIHPRVIKEAASELAPALAVIFNKSVSSGQVPCQWRNSIITPIHKKGPKTDPANYRPISLTSVVCKILERIIVDEITCHLKNNTLSCEQQHGFTHGKSTVTNLIVALDQWTETLSHNLPVDVLFLDYAKAFDTVPHSRLITQLKSFGIDGSLLRWITSFLSDRRQRVKVDNARPEWQPVLSGVPQGSVLGPLLFTLFVWDIPEHIHNNILMFCR